MIKSKNLQITFIAVIFAIICIASLILFQYNRKIQSQNKIITKQLDQLTKNFEQKKVLLSELQHRVKNNLQHVISILELQKESVEFNNIDEFIRGTQNRIHSMAYLHKKLDVYENAKDVDLKKYVEELSHLVKESYENDQKKIEMNILCEIDKLSLDKALPIGLIFVELFSNSMKHAFRDKETGQICIELIPTQIQETYQFNYSDNGAGYDFNQTNQKGLGVEIIKGFIQQLDAEVSTDSTNGFQFNLTF